MVQITPGKKINNKFPTVLPKIIEGIIIIAIE